MRYNYDILDDLDALTTDTKQSVIDNITEEDYDTQIMVMEQVHHDPDEQSSRIEAVLDAFAPFIGAHSPVVYHDSVWTFVFKIRMLDTQFRTCKQLWKFFGALFKTLTDYQHQNARIGVRCGEQNTVTFNDFRRYTDFESHYPYDSKRIIRSRTYPIFHDFGFTQEQIERWVESLFLYDNYNNHKDNWKRQC